MVLIQKILEKQFVYENGKFVKKWFRLLKEFTLKILKNIVLREYKGKS